MRRHHLRSGAGQGSWRVGFICLATAAFVGAGGSGRVWITDIVVDVPSHRYNGAVPFRTIIVGVQNDTTADATFDVSCSWACPVGNVKTFAGSVEQGAYLEAGKSRGYERDLNLACEYLPSALTLTCDLTKKEPPDATGKRKWRTLDTAKKEVAIPGR